MTRRRLRLRFSIIELLIIVAISAVAIQFGIWWSSPRRFTIARSRTTHVVRRGSEETYREPALCGCLQWHFERPLGDCLVRFRYVIAPTTHPTRFWHFDRKGPETWQLTAGTNIGASFPEKGCVAPFTTVELVYDALRKTVTLRWGSQTVSASPDEVVVVWLDQNWQQHLLVDEGSFDSIDLPNDVRKELQEYFRGDGASVVRRDAVEGE